MVIGMLGALGKMNFTSSYFPRRRQFSAREILRLSGHQPCKVNDWLTILRHYTSIS